MRQAEFHLIDMDTWPRRDHYQYYTNLVKTNYHVTANVDISKLRKFCKARKIKFYSAFIYAIVHTVNQIPEFRMALDSDGNLGYYDFLHPSYTIFHKDDETFSDVWTEYNEDFSVFYPAMRADMETYKDVKGVKAKPGTPSNFVPLSGVPWITFTSTGSDTFDPSPMLFPVINFGQYFYANHMPDCIGRTLFENRYLIPVSVFVSHRVADGYHTCKFYKLLQEFCDHAEDWAETEESRRAYYAQFR